MTTNQIQQTVEVYEPVVVQPNISGYAALLRKYSIPYTNNGLYLQVGEIKQVWGWTLDLSSIIFEVAALLETILPILARENVPFTIPFNENIAKAILSGNLGYGKLAKVISIYPCTEQLSVIIAKQLIELTKTFKGPIIPSNYQLEGIVHTRYTNPAENEHLSSFQLPHGVKWPFSDIKHYSVEKRNKKMNGRYLPVKILKDDAKGKVIKAVDQKKWLNNSYCIIKEGKQYLSFDETGRDIRDRLRWQYKLHKLFEGKLPIPRAVTFYEEHGNVYFVMEYIEGAPLSEVIDSLFEGKNWETLAQKTKLELLDYLVAILNIVEQLHNMGYVHRDLSPRNFIIANQQKVFCIDLELIFHLASQEPNPPYVLGTPGYMSPEQKVVAKPTIEEDIYGIGGLLIRVFTCLSPKLFNADQPKALFENLLFLTQSNEVSALICACLDYDPVKRPNLPMIKRFIQHYQAGISCNIKDCKYIIYPTITDFQRAIERSIAGLSTPKFLGANQLWFSKPVQIGKHLSNELFETTHYTGLHTGIGGVLYLLATAHMDGCNVDSCGKAIESNFGHLVSEVLTPNYKPLPGLYQGTPGISLALAKGIKAGWVVPAKQIIRSIEIAFDITPEMPGIRSGIAGQGLALLQCADLLSPQKVNERLNEYTNHLLKAQEKDGSWLVGHEGFSPQRIKLFGFSDGIAGIIYFLLRYYAFSKNDIILNAAVKGLSFLEKHSLRERDMVSWNLYPGNKERSPWFDFGISGIAFSFIQAYFITNNPKYKSIAESTLRNHPFQINSPYLGFYNGISGIGEVYLEAFKTFQSEEWKTRANWIANLLLHTSNLQEDNTIFWITDNSNLPTADLLQGESGIIHYLLRHVSLNNIPFPIFN